MNAGDLTCGGLIPAQALIHPVQEFDLTFTRFQNFALNLDQIAGDLIEIKSEILEAGERKIKFLHRMYECLGGDEASTCEITGVHIDRTLRRSTPFPAYICEKALELSKE